MPGKITIGIIANPASGKDIRRIVAHGSTFDNHEKINIVRRVMLAASALSVERIVYMPDLFGIVPRAAAGIELDCSVEPLPMPVLGNPGDSLEAAMRCRDTGVNAIVTLGGDGTNRVVAKGCGDVPLMPISTGTNNVFPRMVEGTLAGMATALVATGIAQDAIDQQPLLKILIDGEQNDIALIDVVVSAQHWVGARALWDPTHLGEVVVSRIVPAAIGICSIGGLLYPTEQASRRGAHIVIGPSDRSLLVPIAPGLLRDIPVTSSTLIERGTRVALQPSSGTIALDGERELEIRENQRVEVEFTGEGPWVIDIDRAISSAAQSGRFLN